MASTSTDNANDDNDEDEEEIKEDQALFVSLSTPVTKEDYERAPLTVRYSPHYDTNKRDSRWCASLIHIIREYRFFYRKSSASEEGEDDTVSLSVAHLVEWFRTDDVSDINADLPRVLGLFTVAHADLVNLPLVDECSAPPFYADELCATLCDCVLSNTRYLSGGVYMRVMQKVLTFHYPDQCHECMRLTAALILKTALMYEFFPRTTVLHLDPVMVFILLGLGTFCTEDPELWHLFMHRSRCAMLIVPDFVDAFVQQTHRIFATLQFEFNYHRRVEEEVFDNLADSFDAHTTTLEAVAAYMQMDVTNSVFDWVCVVAALRYLCFSQLVSSATKERYFLFLVRPWQRQAHDFFSVCVRSAHDQEIRHFYATNKKNLN